MAPRIMKGIRARVRRWGSRSGLLWPLSYATSQRFRDSHALGLQVYRTIPHDRLREIQKEHGVLLPGVSSAKYLRTQHYLRVAAKHALSLGLEQGPVVRVLDLGSGAGNFLAVARHLNHKILGIDLDDDPMYNDLIEMLEIPRIVHRIQPLTLLPDLGDPLDLITGFSIRFNWCSNNSWNFEQWKFFLEDCRSRMNPGGRIFLRLNTGKADDFRFLPDELAEQIRQLPGVEVSKNKAVIRSASKV